MAKCAFCSTDTEDYFDCDLCGKPVCPMHSLFIHDFELDGKINKGVSICQDHWNDPLATRLIAILKESPDQER